MVLVVAGGSGSGSDSGAVVVVLVLAVAVVVVVVLCSGSSSRSRRSDKRTSRGSSRGVGLGAGAAARTRCYRCGYLQGLDQSDKFSREFKAAANLCTISERGRLMLVTSCLSSMTSCQLVITMKVFFALVLLFVVVTLSVSSQLPLWAAGDLDDLLKPIAGATAGVRSTRDALQQKDRNITVALDFHPMQI